MKKKDREASGVAQEAKGVERDIVLGVDPGSTAPKQVCAAVRRREIVLRSPERAHRVIRSLPVKETTFRRYNLPFSDRKRLREVIREELADSLPFPLDEIAWDFSDRGHGDVFVAATRKTSITAALSGLSKMPDGLDAEPFALARAAVAGGVKDALLVDFGASKTLFCSLKESHLEWVRVVLRGGEALTREIASSRRLSFEEAEGLKKTEGGSLPEARAFLAEVLGGAFLPEPLEAPIVLISGGGAALPNLQDLLEKSLHVPVNLFPVPADLSPYQHVVALGMALKGKFGENGVSLHEMEESSAPWKKWVVLGLIPLFLLSLNLKLREASLQHRDQATRTEMANVVKTNFPAEKRILYPVEQFQKLLEGEKKKLSGGEGEVLGIVADVSKTLEDKNIRIYEMDLENDSFNLKGEAPSFDAVEKWRTTLSQIAASAEVGEQKTTPTKRVSFEMRLKLKKT